MHDQQTIQLFAATRDSLRPASIAAQMDMFAVMELAAADATD